MSRAVTLIEALGWIQIPKWGSFKLRHGNAWASDSFCVTSAGAITEVCLCIISLNLLLVDRE